jgi:SAM-dependent methyltransferase
MERTTYEAEAEVERTHWWFEGRRAILTRFLAALKPPLPPGAWVLDVGCGTGANGPALAEGGRFAVGLDFSLVPLGLQGATGRGHAARLRGDATRLPFRDGAFDMVVALDVLEHIDDDRAAAAELVRVLRPGGVLLVFVPALRLLWGLQDEVSHHRRRYGRAELQRLIAGTGVRIERLTFFNTILFAPILAARLAMRVLPRGQVASENQIGGPISNALLKAIFLAEAPLLDRLDLPIGVSLACVARR